MRILAYLFAGLMMIVIAAAAYLLSVGYPEKPGEWVKFWTYFGGVSAPLLSFVALGAVAHGLRLQAEALKNEREQRSQDRQLRALDGWLREIDEHLDRPQLKLNERLISLRLVLLGGPESEEANASKLKECLQEYLLLLSRYCEMVAIYRENVSPYFETKVYRDRGGKLLDMIKPFDMVLQPAAGVTIEFCDMHLRGDNERKTSEAMNRSSRH